MSKPMIIEAAVNGGLTTKADNANVPYTPHEIAADAIAAVDAGASVVHLHVRASDGGRLPSAAAHLDAYRETFRLIRAARDPLICPTFPIGDPDKPGTASADPEPRFRHFRQLAEDPATRADLGVMDAGSLNIPAYDAVTKTVRNPGHSYVNNFATVRYFVEGFRDLGIPATLNCFEPGFLRTALILAHMGIASAPLVVRFYFSCVFGLPPSEASLAAYMAMASETDCEWFGCCIDEDVRPHLAMFARAAGHVRVGLEDFAYAADQLSNADLVRLAGEAAAAAGRRVATPAEARALLGA